MNQAYLLPWKRVGQEVKVWGGAKIVSPEAISLGDRVIIDDFVFLMGGESTEIGSFVHIGAHGLIVGGGRLIMADFSSLSGRVSIYTGNEDYLGGCLTNPTVPSPYRIPERAYVTIGRHAIIGAGCVVLPGVTIGEGASVGALSLVKGDLEPWTIYAGIPARPIRKRPREKILLLETMLRRKLYDDEGRYVGEKE